MPTISILILGAACGLPSQQRRDKEAHVPMAPMAAAT